MDKSPDAFRTISEVAGDLDLPQHVLRFWETRFNQIRPLKRGGGRRYYRPDDVDLLKGIRHLLYGEGYTIRGVQRILKEQGVRFVMEVWREGAPQPARGGERTVYDDGDLVRASPPRFEDEGEPEEAREALPDDARPWEVTPPLPDASEIHEDDEPEGETVDRIEPVMRATPSSAPVDPEIRAAHVLAQRFAPRAAGPSEPRIAPTPVSPPQAPPRAQPAAPEPRAALGHLLDRLRPNHVANAPVPVPPPVTGPMGASGADGTGLSRDDVRRLQATLFELLECKRLLDQVR